MLCHSHKYIELFKLQNLPMEERTNYSIAIQKFYGGGTLQLLVPKTSRTMLPQEVVFWRLLLLTAMWMLQQNLCRYNLWTLMARFRRLDSIMFLGRQKVSGIAMPEDARSIRQECPTKPVCFPMMHWEEIMEDVSSALNAAISAR